MPHGFAVYIDEAGDEGYNFARPPAKFSSEWFLIGAVACTTGSLRQIERDVPDSFHFKKKDHWDKVAFLELVANLPIKAFVVAAHKPSIDDNAALRNEKHFLFNYCSKLLLERVSWYCNSSGPGTAQIILSQRRHLSLHLFREYLQRLKDDPVITTGGKPVFRSATSIKWNVIDPANIEMRKADSLPGLRVADAVVSGAFRAVEWSPAYNTEHRYIKILKPKFYRSGIFNRCHGMKFVPDNAVDRCSDPFEPNRFHWLRHFS